MFIKLFLLLTLPFYYCSGSCFFQCQLYWLNNRRVYECTGNSSYPKSCDSDQLAFTTSSSDLTPRESGRLVMPSGELEIPPGIMALHIRHANIGELKAFESPEVVTLVLEDCNLVNVRPRAFQMAQNLHHLDLSNNLLKNIEFQVENSKIDKLILSHNLLTTLPQLHKLRSLRYLYLSNNLIKEISGGSLLLSRLDYVDLSGNKLRTIKKTDLSPSIKFLVLDGNPWRCDCNFRGFVEYQRETYITRSLECVEPSSMKGTNWNDLLPLDFACGPYIEGPFLNDLTVTEGKTFALSCTASGDPIPIIQFKRSKSKEPIVSVSQRIIVNQSSHGNSTTKVLEFLEALPSDAGTYWCLAKTGLNTTAKRFDITVEPQRSRPYQNADSKKQKPERTTFKSGGVAILLSVITIALIVLSLSCFILAMYYKHKKAEEKSASGRRRSFTGTSRLTDKGDAEVLSTKQLLYDEPVHPVLLVTKPEDFDDTLGSHIRPTGTETSMVTDVSVEKEGAESKGETSMGSRGDLCPRKAPLAQYDRDTYVFPIVQTSL